MKLLVDFSAAYCRLADEGACDFPGGGEYNRVRAAWLAAGRPDDVEGFIRLYANRPPDSGDVGGVQVADLDAEIARLEAERAAKMASRTGGGEYKGSVDQPL